MIEVSHLSKKYGTHPAIEDLSFTVGDGQIFGLLGPNGAGKSTIMNILTGYLAPTSGEVKVAGFSLPEQAQQAKACVGYLPEQPPLYPEMTVQEYLDFAAELKGIKKKADRKEQVRKAARRTGLEEVLPRLIRSLSKGYRQRVGIAQALLGAPQLIILDEPTVGLDPAQVIEIRRLIRELGKSHTVILSSHILSEVQAVCSQVLILSKGHLVAVGAPEQLAEKLNPGSRLRATALGGGKTVLKAVGSIPGIRKVEIESEADGQVTFTAESADASDRRAEVSRALSQAGCTVLALAAENPELTRVRHNGLDDSPQLQIDIDQRKAQALGVAIDDINDTLQTAWGSSYVNDFMDRGRVKKVYVQAAAPYRMLPDDINLWYVRNKDGGMVPFSAFATSRWETGSPRLERYNGYSAVEIVGEAAPGVSTGTAMDIMESLVKQLPNGFGLEWTAMSYQERLSGAQAPALYAISLLVVFLCLAALYESWSVPFSVMLVVPLGVIGALLATWMRGLENDVYFQVGLLTVIGLSAKNAILIVEFANEMNQKGHDLFEATLHACRQRLRPILMTSLAFIFGVLPMATSTGAGSGGQHAVGTGVMGGMISATILAIYFVPLFFVLVRRRFPLKPRPE